MPHAEIDIPRIRGIWGGVAPAYRQRGVCAPYVILNQVQNDVRGTGWTGSCSVIEIVS